LPWPCCCCSPPVLEAAISGKLNSFTFYLCLHLLRDCLLLTGFALLAGKLKSPLASFVIAWLILNIAAPLLAYGMGGYTGAMFVQPVVAMWMSSPDGIEQAGAWLSYVPWASLSLQILVTLAWVIHVFRDRVLGFARDNAAAHIRES
jgi:hypothetical protein